VRTVESSEIVPVGVGEVEYSVFHPVALQQERHPAAGWRKQRQSVNGVCHSDRILLQTSRESQPLVRLSCLNSKWKKCSPVRITERTHEEATQIPDDCGPPEGKAGLQSFPFLRSKRKSQSMQVRLHYYGSGDTMSGTLKSEELYFHFSDFGYG
jgi:hypothetical protein